MKAREVLEYLNIKRRGDSVMLPAMVIDEGEYPREIFLLNVARHLEFLKPNKVEINNWPDKIMPYGAVRELLVFLSQNTTCPIMFDFSNQTDDWIRHFYHDTKTCYSVLANKPKLCCFEPTGSLKGWDDKFMALSSRTRTYKGAYVKAYLSVMNKRLPVDGVPENTVSNTYSLL